MKHPAFHSLFEANFVSIRPYIQNNKLEAYRLYNNEHSSLPVAVDIYLDCAVIHVLQRIPPQTMQDLEKTLRELLKIRFFFYKDRTKKELLLPKSRHKEIIVKEYGHRFLINLSDYLDTGLFLDHRKTRKWLGAQSKGKKVLNTFAYTASFSVYAARGGATKTYSIDLSRTYCDWIKRNFKLNNLPLEHNWIYKMDTLEFFRYAKRKNLTFDIIIIDPPTFSKNKTKHFSVQKDHTQLINAALEILTPTGFIFFSNNYRDFHLNRQKIHAKNIKEKKDTIPPDFTGSIPHQCWIIKSK